MTMMLELQNVTCAYGTAPPAVSDVSLKIRAGERVGLIGANGAGKSTLMKAVLGLIGAEGTILAEGVRVEKKTLPEIRRKIGYVLQDSNDQMFMPTVLEDVLFGPLNYGMPREDALALADRILERLGISALRDRANHRISGGEKRMAAIAAVLALEPGMLLMDEPSAALDPKNRRRVIRVLNGLPQTMLIASHDLDMILETCGRVILLAEGKIAADGPAEEILRDRTLLEANGLELPFCLAGPPKPLQ